MYTTSGGAPKKPTPTTGFNTTPQSPVSSASRCTCGDMGSPTCPVHGNKGNQSSNLGTPPQQPNQTPTYGQTSTPAYNTMTTREALDDQFKRGGFFKEDYEQDELQKQRLAQQQRQNQPSAFDNGLRKAEQLTSAGLNGVSRGWYDEYEGAAGGLGYGIGSLNSAWNKRNESFGEAFKRGYQQTRDNRRNVLENAYSEQPIASTVAETAGAIAKSPLDFFGGKSKLFPLISGTIYGAGVTNQNDHDEYAKNIGLGIAGNLVGEAAGANMFSPNANPLFRNATKELAGKTVSVSFEGLSETSEEDDEKKKRWLRMLGIY